MHVVGHIGCMLLQQRADVNLTSVSAPLGEVPGPMLGVAGGCEGANLMRGRPSFLWRGASFLRRGFSFPPSPHVCS